MGHKESNQTKIKLMGKKIFTILRSKDFVYLNLCINVLQVPSEMLKLRVMPEFFQLLLRDLANINELKNNV